MHPRRRCVKAFANTLLGNPQPAESETPTYPIEEVLDRVYTNRRSALWQPELPCICIFALSEEASTTPPSPEYDRKVRIIAEIVVEATENSDELCDDIALKVENLLAYNRRLPDPAYTFGSGESPFPPETNPANTAEDLMMFGTMINLAEEVQEANITTCRIAFDVEYITGPNYSEAADIFDTMSVKYKIPGKDDNTPTADDFKSGIYQE